MAVAGSLIVEIGANIAALRKDLEHSQKEIEKFRKQSETHAKTMESNWSTSIAGIKKAWVVGLGAMGSAVYAVGVAWRALKLSAEYAEQKGILDNLATKYNTTADGIIEAMGRASEGLISKSDLMQNALEGVSKGLRPDQLIELAEAARVLGDVVGKDATTALNELTQALETGRVKGLRNYLGTAIDLEAIFGKLTNRLTETEKAQALYAITMIETRKIQASMNTTVDETADRMERLEAKYKDTKLALSNLWKEAVVATVAFFDSNTWANDNYLKQLAQAKATEQHTKSIREKTIAVKESLAPYEREIAALKKIIQTRGEDEKKVKSSTKEVKQSLSDQKKAIDALEDAWVATDNAINSMTQDVERGVDETLNGIERIKREQEDAYRKWMHDNGTLFDGIRSGFNDSREDMYTWFDAGRDGFYAFASDSSNIVSSVLFDGMTGDLKSFGDYWESFWKAQLKTFTDIMGKMVIQDFMSQLAGAGLGGSLWSTAGAAGGGAAAGTYAAGGAAAGFTAPAIAGYPGFATGSASGSAAGGGSVLGPAAAALAATFGANALTNATIGESGGGRNALTLAAPFFDPIGSVNNIYNALGFGGGRDLKTRTYDIYEQSGRLWPNLIEKDGVAITTPSLAIIQGKYLSHFSAINDAFSMYMSYMEKYPDDAQTTVHGSIIETLNRISKDTPIKSKGLGDSISALSAYLSDYLMQAFPRFTQAMYDEYGYAKGLNYVPSDNFPAFLHKGEAVLTKKEADQWRGSGETHIHFHGMVIDANACQEFAYEFAPYMHKAFAQGH